MIKPDFFIVGAPKCGTTSMYDYLQQHPDIFMPRTKEPQFFASDLQIDPPWRVPTKATYLQLFENAGEVKRVGEASTWYLFSTRAAAAIREFSPDAKIIIMLRNPVDFINSLHLQMINGNNEDIIDLGEALRAEPDRRKGLLIPTYARFPRCLIYTDVATFTPQVERYFQAFGRDAVRVILLDDMVEDPVGVYRQTLEFLGVDPTLDADLAPHNKSRSLSALDLRLKRLYYRAQWFRRVFKATPTPLLAVYRTVTSKMMPTIRRTSMDPQLREELTDWFKPEIDRLGDLIRVDLSHWYKTGGTL